jgi:hypothetical protein
LARWVTPDPLAGAITDIVNMSPVIVVEHAAGLEGNPSRPLKKIDNTAADTAVTAATASGIKSEYLPKRRPVNVEFQNLTYSVSEGRKKGQGRIAKTLLRSSLICKLTAAEIRLSPPVRPFIAV